MDRRARESDLFKRETEHLRTPEISTSHRTGSSATVLVLYSLSWLDARAMRQPAASWAEAPSAAHAEGHKKTSRRAQIGSWRAMLLHVHMHTCCIAAKNGS